MLWPEEWTGAERVDLLKGTPINCVLLPPKSGGGVRWEPVAAAMRHAGIDVVAWPVEGAGATIRRQEREEVDWADPSAVWLVDGCVWPKVAARSAGDASLAGPTGLPWVDSNGWFLQLALTRAPDKALWLRATPPAEGRILSPSSYAVAVADCEAYGGRWVVELEARLRHGLVSGDASAKNTWQTLIETLRFFRGGDGGRQAQPQGALAALSDFTADNQFLGHEFLNLIAREYVPVRILWKGAPPAVPAGVRMVASLDPAPLPPAWKSVLADFVRGGGGLMTARSADPGFGARVQDVTGLDYQMRSYGKGRVAVALEAFDDPFRVAADAHLLLGRRHDLVRLANAGSCILAMTQSADGRRATLCIVNYAGRPGLNPVSATLLRACRAARLRIPERPGTTNLPLRKEYDRTALELPEFRSCAVVDLEL
jgi:hypothetical protein